MNDPFLQYPLINIDKSRQSLISRGKSLNKDDPYTFIIILLYIYHL